jgi:hypothetical protein
LEPVTQKKLAMGKLLIDPQKPAEIRAAIAAKRA